MGDFRAREPATKSSRTSIDTHKLSPAQPQPPSDRAARAAPPQGYLLSESKQPSEKDTEACQNAAPGKRDATPGCHLQADRNGPELALPATPAMWAGQTRREYSAYIDTSQPSLGLVSNEV